MIGNLRRCGRRLNYGLIIHFDEIVFEHLHCGQHLPGFVEKAAELKAKGVDEIICTAVNDPFVIGIWGAQKGSTDITFLADGNADFVKALGLTMDGSGFGLGTRGQRFALVAKDGVVEKLFVEAPGEFKVSTAEHVLESL